jgi:hypothetical protein
MKILETINKEQLVPAHLQVVKQKTSPQQYTSVIVDKVIYFNPCKEISLTIKAYDRVTGG